MSGNLYNAPIKDLPGGVHNVLDIGTGTGIWALDFGKFSFHVLYTTGVLTEISATEFSSANVIGTDLSPIQPEL